MKDLEQRKEKTNTKPETLIFNSWRKEITLKSGGSIALELKISEVTPQEFVESADILDSLTKQLIKELYF